MATNKFDKIKKRITNSEGEQSNLFDTDTKSSVKEVSDKDVLITARIPESLRFDVNDFLAQKRREHGTAISLTKLIRAYCEAIADPEDHRLDDFIEDTSKRIVAGDL